MDPPIAEFNCHHKDVMAFNAFEQQLRDLQQHINPNDSVSILVHSMMSTIHEGFRTSHKQVSDINARIGQEYLHTRIADLDKAARQIDRNLQQVAAQVAEGLGHHQSVDKYKKESWSIK